MKNHLLVLIATTYEEDEIGNMMPVEELSEVFCEVKSVKQNEFYNAANAGLKPEVVFIINDLDYNDASVVECESKRYKVIRTYTNDFHDLEIVCERVLGNG